MIDTVGTPKLIHPVTILKLEERMLKINGTYAISEENKQNKGNKTNGQVKKNYKRAGISKSLY